MLAPWQALASQSLEPAGTNAPELMLALARHVPGLELAIVKMGSDFAFAAALMKPRRPWRLKTNATTSLTFCGTPHLAAGLAEPAYAAFLATQDQPVMLQSVATGGPFWRSLTAGPWHCREVRRWQRACLHPTGSFDHWFDNNFDRKRRKEFRRLHNRLAESGQFEQLTLSPGDDVATWTEELLALEAAGWKGQRGTAIANDAGESQATRQGLPALARAGKLRFWKLVLDGRVIAAMFAIVEGSKAWLGKIAYDESFARFSPGVLLILHATRQLTAETGLTCIDSCAIPGHPMIENIWRDRLTVADVIVAPATLPAWRVTAATRLEQGRRRLRGLVRDLYFNLLKGKHRS